MQTASIFLLRCSLLSVISVLTTPRTVPRPPQGRLGKKADKASKRMWEYGLTSVSTFDDHVDNAEYAAQTRAGVIGVQVGGGSASAWLRIL